MRVKPSGKESIYERGKPGNTDGRLPVAVRKHQLRWLRHEQCAHHARAGDGGTYDIGIATLSAAAERNENLIYICHDNEIYGNTGGQRKYCF